MQEQVCARKFREADDLDVFVVVAYLAYGIAQCSLVGLLPDIVIHTNRRDAIRQFGGYGRQPIGILYLNLLSDKSQSRLVSC